MKIKSIIILMAYLLLFSGLNVPATACCEGDPPGEPSCYICVDGVWVVKAWFECGQHSDCTGGCYAGCWLCTCVLRPGAECAVDSDCPTEAYCDEYCYCVCDSGSCWDLQTVPRVDEVCPDCSGFFAACEGTIEISDSYQIWVPKASGEYGYCKHPTKTETVGFIFECTEDWDVTEIIKCAAESVLCYYVCTTLPWPACVACLVIEGIDCALEGACSFVEDCIPSDDPDDAVPIINDVVDWGADWGDRRKCG